MAARKRKDSQPPWDHPAPTSSPHTHLSAAGKRAAKNRAKKAGRPYPNLVDNMHEAARRGGKK
jgi:hypothetical protein